MSDPQIFDVDVSDESARICFTSRTGGASQGPWTSLNLQTGGDDDPAAVTENFSRLRRALGGAEIALMDQVHGCDIHWVDANNADKVPVADALITTRSHVALMVRVADCVPVLMHAPEIGAVAAVHVGRGGLLHDIIPRVTEVLHQYGARDVRAWIGPRVCGRCYELPAAMAQDVENHIPGSRTTTSDRTPGVDIGAGVISQLTAERTRIIDVGARRCTIEDEELYSYRRQGGQSGRFAGLIMRQ